MLARCAVVVALLILGGTALPAQPPARGSAPQTPVAAPVAASALSPRNASYAISARLDPRSRTLTGDELLTWRNISRRPAETLQFHLYYNAWRNTHSTWMQERVRRNPALAARPEGDWSWIDLTSLRVIPRGGTPADLLARARFIAPDDGNAEDRTVLEVPLDRPVAPGETINVQIGWSSRVPRTFDRTGVVGDFYFLAQWFPKIGVLEDGGWNTHQFHSATEFFADFGSYDVRLTVPKGWTVGATGLERERRDEADGTTTHRYAQDDVHDFAWTTSPRLIERTATLEQPGRPAVALRLLLQPEHAGQADRHVEAARATLTRYGNWFGPYPYSHLTIVDPAWQSGAGGMEYPTLITAGSRWLAPRDSTTPESVVVHETGHQFLYGVVASNEFEDGWMDEGINTYAQGRVIAEAYQPNYYTKRYFGGFIPWVFHGFPLQRFGDRMPGYRAAARSDVPSTPTWRYSPLTASAITYTKTALWMQTLERMIGWPAMQRAMSAYYARWAFRHPKPDDFFAIVNEVSGQDLTWFFDQVYRGSAVFDYAVQSLRSERQSVRGYVGEGGSRTFASGRDGEGYVSTVVVSRRGEGIFPVDVRLLLEGGDEVRWHWDGRDRWKQFQVVRPARAVSVDVDPDRVLVLDVNTTNNSASLAPRAEAAARKWSLAWMIWLQDHLMTYGFFV